MATRNKARGGIVTRHSRRCNTALEDAGRCNCTPTYLAWIYSVKEKKNLYKSFPGDLAAARSWLADADRDLRQGKLRTVTRDTVEQAGDAWIARARAGEVHARGGKPYKPSVIRSYEISLRLHANPELGDYRLSELTTPDLQRFVNRMVAKKANPSTIRNTLNPLRAIYRDAIAEGHLAVNPCFGLRLPSADGVRDRIADPVEAEKLIEGVLEDDRALWATAFYGGLRRGELRALRCRHVDIKGGRISVEAGWDDIEGEIDPKSKKGTRTTPIPTVLSKRLAAHILKTGRSGDDFIFGATSTRPFAPSYVRLRARNAWASRYVCGCAVEKPEDGEEPPLLCPEHKQPKPTPITLHEARHTYVSLMYAAGVPLETIGDYVGHSSAYMTDRYRHLLPGSHDDARKKLDALLSNA